MNIVADEGIDRQIVEQLRQAGHDVLYVAELAPSISDDEVLQQYLFSFVSNFQTNGDFC
jgi:hypothetical protein